MNGKPHQAPDGVNSVLNGSPLLVWCGQASSGPWGCKLINTGLPPMKPGGQHKDVCRSGGWGFCTQDVPEDCIEFWEGQGFEDSSKNTANELCKCEGINLYDHSLRIKIGRKKRSKSWTFPEKTGVTGETRGNSLAKMLFQKPETSAQGWCTGKTQRNGMEREVGRGDRDGEHM